MSYEAINANHQVRHTVSEDAQIALKDGIKHTLNKPHHDPAGVCQHHHTPALPPSCTVCTLVIYSALCLEYLHVPDSLLGFGVWQ